MANTTKEITGTLLDASDERGQRQLVQVSATNLYVFYAASNGDLVYKKSTDGGDTWGSEVILDATADWHSVTCWFDQWTPTDTTGTIIHIVATDHTNDNVTYFGIDTSDDSTVTNNNVDVDTTFTIGAVNGAESICKAANDDLYVSSTMDTDAGITVHRSTDDGATWADISSLAG